MIIRPHLSLARPQARPAGQSHRGWTSESCCGEDRPHPNRPGHTSREICHAHHLDDHHWVHRRCDREVRHARRQRTVRIHSHNNSWDSRSLFSHLSRPSDRLVSRGRTRWPNWSSGRRDNYLSDLGIHCWPPPPVSLVSHRDRRQLRAHRRVLHSPRAPSRHSASASGWRHARCRSQVSNTRLIKSQHGLPMTLGNAAGARVRLIV